MTQEEKAKAYDESIERAKKELNTCGSQDCDAARQIFRFFPELKKSEDEKIRKSILELVKQSSHILNPMNQKSMIAWLEKQSEKKIPKNIDDAALQYVDTCAIDGEITHDNITEPYWNNHSMMNAYKAGWLEKQGHVKESQVSQHKNITCKENDDSLTSEDERIRKRFICFLTNLLEQGGIMADGWDRKECEEYITWLERQRDQNKWKPSKDEMDALYGLAYITNKMDDRKDVAITKLYQDLKREFFNGASYENMFLLSPVDSDINIKEQCEQKPVDKVKPKFKVGDWITNGDCIIKITSVDDRYYWHDNDCIGGDIESIDKEYRLWTIQDAKDGDVLDFDCGVGIFKNLSVDGYNAHCYCYYDTNSQLEINDCSLYDTYNAEPATKEQRDTLFAKMKEAKYEWDAENKKLKKIEHKFKVGDIIKYVGEREEFSKEKHTIKKILDDCYLTIDDMYIPFKFEEYYILINQNQSWSEEDEKMRKLLIDILNVNHPNGFYMRGVIHKDAVVDWLKSLKPQKHWKPNKEQMEALEDAISCRALPWEQLESLYNDLKNL